MRWSIYVCVALVAFSACAAEKKGVARIGDRTIGTEELRCPSDLVQDQCGAYRQSRFDRMAKDLLIDAAAKLHDITIPPNVIERNAVQIPDADVRKAEAQYKLIVRAALAVRQGEERDAVHQRDLAPHGVTVQQFDSVLRTIPDVATAERALRLDMAQESRRQMADQARRRLVLEQLGRIVDATARASGVSFEAAEKQFWSEVVAKTETEVHDASLRLPALEGTLRP